MDDILGSAFSGSDTRSYVDDDFADRLSSRYTVIQLVMFAVLIGFTQYVRTPMTCWTPVHFTDAHTDFTNNYCWIKNTYYLPWDKPLPNETGTTYRQMIQYYQWIPFILLTQAILFYIPSAIWHGLNRRSGVDTSNIIVAALTLSTVDMTETGEWVLRIIVNQMDRFLGKSRKRSSHKSNSKILDKLNKKRSAFRSGYYMLILYLVTKVLYIANAIGQLFLLNVMLVAKYSSLGVDISRSLATDVDWTEESFVAFPRVTLCDFKVRGQDMGNVHPYTVQCVLPVNIYNEKIYLFLWFWMLIVAFASILSLVIWLVRSVVPIDQERFIRTHVDESLKERYPNDEREREKVLKEFTHTYLRHDGVLLLRLIIHNIDSITCSEITCALFDKWHEMGKNATNELDESDESDPLNLSKSE